MPVCRAGIRTVQFFWEASATETHSYHNIDPGYLGKPFHF